MMSPYLRRRLYTVLGVLVLTGVAWTLGRQLEHRFHENAEQKEAADRVFACDGNIVGIELGSPNDEAHRVVVARRASPAAPYDAKGAWRLEAPLGAAADETAVEAVLEAACALKRQTRIEAKEGEPPLALSAFGLEPPKKLLRLVFADGHEQRLEVGDPSAFNQTLYVRRVADGDNGPSRIDVVDQGFSFQAERDAFSLRDKRLVHVKNADVKRIEVAARGKQSFLVEQREGGQYRIVQQSDATLPLDGDPQAIGGWLDSLVNLRAKQFLDEAPAPGRLSHFALDPPSFEVTLVMPDANERVVVRLGTLMIDKAAHAFAQLNAPTAPVVELEAPSVIDKLADGGSSLRDMRLLHCAAADVTRIEIHEQDKSVTLVRQVDAQKSEWALDGNEAMPLDSSKISSMLYRLTHLRADTLSTEGADPAQVKEAHLDSPELAIRLLDSKGDVLGHLRVGAANAERRVAMGDGERIGQIFASATEGVSANADDYASHKP